MKLFYCFSESHRLLHDRYFVPTLPASFERNPIECDVQGTGDFLSPDFLACVTFKVDRIIESLERNRGEILLWSDVDILFFRDVTAELEDLVTGSSAEILFQREGRAERAGVNTGFFVCRATDHVRAFFLRLRDHMAAHPHLNEQYAANDLLAHDPVPWGCLPLSYYARTHGWPPPRDLAIYHANFTAGADGIGQKVRQFEEIRWVRKSGTLAWGWSCARRVPGKLWRTLLARKTV